MYYEESEILYAKNDGFQMVSLPYKDGYSMIICLPKSYNPLDVTEDIFNQLKNDLSINNRRIIIPKFEILLLILHQLHISLKYLILLSCY